MPVDRSLEKLLNLKEGKEGALNQQILKILNSWMKFHEVETARVSRMDFRFYPEPYRISRLMGTTKEEIASFVTRGSRNATGSPHLEIARASF